MKPENELIDIANELAQVMNAKGLNHLESMLVVAMFNRAYDKASCLQLTGLLMLPGKGPP